MMGWELWEISLYPFLLFVLFLVFRDNSEDLKDDKENIMIFGIVMGVPYLNIVLGLSFLMYVVLSWVV